MTDNAFDAQKAFLIPSSVYFLINSVMKLYNIWMIMSQCCISVTWLPTDYNLKISKSLKHKNKPTNQQNVR